MVGVPDDVYGQRVVALIKMRAETRLSGKEAQSNIKAYLATRLAYYKHPKVIVILPDSKELPRNHLGKINKKEVIKSLQLETLQ